MRWPWVKRGRFDELLKDYGRAVNKLDALRKELCDTRIERDHWKSEWAKELLVSTATVFSATKGK